MGPEPESKKERHTMITSRNLSNGTNIERYTVAEMRETLTELSRENCDAVKIYYKDGSLACFYGDDYDPRDLREALSKTGIRSIIQEGGWYIWYTGSAKNILMTNMTTEATKTLQDLLNGDTAEDEAWVFDTLAD